MADHLESPEPILENGGRWDHIASDAEIMRAMRFDKEVIVHEVPFLSMTYVVSRKYLTTIRCGGQMGGGTRDIEGGWVYPNDLFQRLDEEEIKRLVNNPMNAAF